MADSLNLLSLASQCKTCRGHGTGSRGFGSVLWESQRWTSCWAVASVGCWCQVNAPGFSLLRGLPPAISSGKERSDLLPRAAAGAVPVPAQIPPPAYLSQHSVKQQTPYLSCYTETKWQHSRSLSQSNICYSWHFNTVHLLPDSKAPSYEAETGSQSGWAGRKFPC